MFRTTIACIMGLMATTVSAADYAFPGATWQIATPESQGMDSSKLQQAFAAIGADRGNTVVIRNGYQVWVDGNEATRHATFSASKSITAMISARLLQQGVIAADETIPMSNNPEAAKSAWSINDFGGGYVGGDLATFRDFWTMTAQFGLSGRTPGSQCAYNNNGVHFYGTHMRINHFNNATPVAMLQQALFDLIGGHQDGLSYNGQFGGWNGGWRMSARDAARLGLLLLAEGRWNGVQVLPTEWCREALDAQVPPGTTVNFAKGPDDWWNQEWLSELLPGDYGYSFWTMDGGAARASGRGGNYIIVDPANDLVIAVINNKPNTKPAAESYLAEIRKAIVAPNPLPGQIMVDPDRGNYLVRNQDLDGDGAFDPFMMAGVGGPEQFLYLGNRQADGTRSGGRQQVIIDELIASGANGIYIQSIRSFGGDAGSDNTQAPFNTPTDPDSGLDPEIMAQWHGWFGQMRDADIGILFFIYDDHAKPWGSNGDAVPAGEQAFLTAITDEFEGYPNIIFVMAEEFQFAGFSNARMSNMAAVVAAADDHNHALGVHHNIGLANQFVGDANINVYVQQADLRNGDKMAKLHGQYGTDQGFDEQGRYAYIMGEGFGYHQNLIGKSNKRDELRRSLYATAMAGGIVTVFGAYETEWGRDPTQNNLDDMGRVVEFFHSTPFNTMDHNDALAFGDTDWVKAKVGERYLAYSKTVPTNGMGVTGLPNGSYTLRWFDAKDGEWVIQTGINGNGDTAFPAPAAMNNDTIVEIILTDGTPNPAPSIDDIHADPAIVLVDSTQLFVTASDTDPLTYNWSVDQPAFVQIGSGEDPLVSFTKAGTFVFTVSVSDGNSTVHDQVTVEVIQKPTAIHIQP